MDKKVEEMKKQYVRGVVLIGLIAIMVCFFGMIQMIQYQNQVANLNEHLEKSLETNVMLNNQLLNKSLETQMVKADLNTCVNKYNVLYREANQMYQYITSLGDVNE